MKATKLGSQSELDKPGTSLEAVESQLTQVGDT